MRSFSRLCVLLRTGTRDVSAYSSGTASCSYFAMQTTQAASACASFAATRQMQFSQAALAAHLTGGSRYAPRAVLQQVCLRGFASVPRDSPGGMSQKLRQRVTEQQRTSADQRPYLIALIVGMVGLTYAAVPLYRLFCQATGFGGTVQQGSTVEEKLKRRALKKDADLEAAAASREITVFFNADTADGMPWKFTPTQHSVKIRPGQSTLAFYTAHNTSTCAVTGVSTYNVAPQKAGLYFNKIQCFCFEEQKLRPGEKVDMPVFFYIDPEFATDIRLKGVDHLTLSYTFFKVDEDKETPAQALTRILAENPEQQAGMMTSPAHAAR